jgi:hypothetical protein
VDFDPRRIHYLLMTLENMIKHFLHGSERKNFSMTLHILTNDLSLMVKGCLVKCDT